MSEAGDKPPTKRRLVPAKDTKKPRRGVDTERAPERNGAPSRRPAQSRGRRDQRMPGAEAAPQERRPTSNLSPQRAPPGAEPGAAPARTGSGKRSDPAPPKGARGATRRAQTDRIEKGGARGRGDRDRSGGTKGRGARGGKPPRRPVDPVAETMEPTTLPVLRARERRVHVLADQPSDPRYGRRPAERSIEELLGAGLVILDKPRGPTSHQVVAWLRDVLGVDKVGHGGTLDPRVSGVLPTTTGDATKAVGALLTVGKEYIAVMRLHGDADEATIRREAQRFVGRVRQVPPVRSAVARRARMRRIYDLQVLEVQGRDVLLRVQSEAGTYIRNLCVDLGAAIGTRGHMAELRRSRTGLFGEDEAVTLTDVKDAVHFWKEDGDAKPLRAMIHPVERVIEHLPQIRLRDSAVDAICHGADLAAPGVAAVETGIKAGDTVQLLSGKEEAVALAVAEQDAEAIVNARTGVVARLERVLMKPGTYPSSWKGRGHTRPL